MTDSAPLRQQLDAAMTRYLVIELEVGLAFAQAAANAEHTKDLLHNRQIARRAYDSACMLMRRAYFHNIELHYLQNTLQKLRLALRGLGDPCLSPERNHKAFSNHHAA
jgi:hypothetical protein